MIKSRLQCRRPGFNPWVGKIPWRRAWQSTPVFLPGKSHGQRTLVGYSPWSHIESDITQWLTHTHTHTHTPIAISWVTFLLEKKNWWVKRTSSFPYPRAAVDHLTVFIINDNATAAHQSTHYQVLPCLGHCVCYIRLPIQASSWPISWMLFYRWDSRGQRLPVVHPSILMANICDW